MSGSKIVKKVNTLTKIITLVLCFCITFQVYTQEVDLPLSKNKQQQPKNKTKPTPKQNSEEASIYLNFENASLASVVNYLAEQRNINLIPPTPSKDFETQKISLTTRQPLTVKRAWDVLLTLLEINNFTIIKVGNIYRIVPSKDHKKEPLPFYSSERGTLPEDLPDNDLIVRYLYALENIKTEVAEGILKDLLGEGKVQSLKELGICIITDKCFSIKAAMKIIKVLDTEGLRETIKIKHLKHANADEIAKIFKEITGKEDEKKKTIRFIGPKEEKEVAFFSSSTRIIPEPRHNTLILMGLEKNINKIIEFIDKKLDISMEAAESRLHIKEIKYAKPGDLASILNTIKKAPQGKEKGGEFKFFEDVIIKSEEAKKAEGETRGSGNRLIIACNKDDWLRLDKLIDKLDKPLPQVALEVMIVDIDTEKSKNLGTQIREKTGKSFAKGLTAFTTNLRAVTIDAEGSSDINLYNSISGALVGTSGITIGNAGDTWAVIKSFLSDSQTNIVSQPFLTTSNNHTCYLEISNSKRIPGAFTKGETRHLEYKPVSAKTTVKITPRINVEGLVNLDIEIHLSEFLATTEDATTYPQSKRDITTQTSIATGEVLVLGGLTKDKVSDATYKTPVLGDIPILGNLFKSKQKTIYKTNLYVFIRPSIIKPKFEGGVDDYTQLKLDYAKYQILNAEDIHKTKDPIQRWFFKPERESIKQTLADLNNGVYRPLDDYVQGKEQPKSVRIERDPYYRAEEGIKSDIEKKAVTEKMKKTKFQRKKKLTKINLAQNKSNKQYQLPSARKRT